MGGAGGSGGGGEEWPVRPVGNLSRIVGQAGGMGPSAGAATGEEGRKGERVVLMRIGRHEDVGHFIISFPSRFGGFFFFLISRFLIFFLTIAGIEYNQTGRLFRPNLDYLHDGVHDLVFHLRTFQ